MSSASPDVKRFWFSIPIASSRYGSTIAKFTAPMDFVNGFRAMSVMAVTTFWIAEAIILGLLWQKYKTKLQEP